MRLAKLDIMRVNIVQYDTLNFDHFGRRSLRGHRWDTHPAIPGQPAASTPTAEFGECDIP